MGGALGIAVMERSFGNEMNNVRSWKSFSFALLPLTICTSSMLRLDQAGNLTDFYLKVKHLSILPETWRVVWYRYY